MYLTVKIALRKTKNHDDDNYPVINKGEKFLQISNGTLGAGARARNISKTSAIKMLEEALEELRYEDPYDDDILSIEANCTHCDTENLVGTNCPEFECGECGALNRRMKYDQFIPGT